MVRTASGLPALIRKTRVDPIVTTSGLFRGPLPGLLINMDRAYGVALAASYRRIVEDPELRTSLDYVLQTLVDAKYTNFRGNESLDTLPI